MSYKNSHKFNNTNKYNKAMDKRKPIDFRNIINSIIRHKKPFFYGIPISIGLSCCLVLCIPRFYTCSVSLAPEVMNTSSTSSLSSLASSFGVNLSDKLGAMTDAFYPEIYPDILNTTSFRISLTSIPIKTKDGSVHTNYYSYLEKYQKFPWWIKIIGAIRQKFSDKSKTPVSSKLDPFMLSKKQYDILDAIGGNVTCSVDKRTQIISITVKDQDPLVCALIADSARCKLQKFITDYRTSKARADMKQIHTLYVDAKRKYERARQQYAAYSDSNIDPILMSVNSKRDDYENEMQLQYNNYSNLAMQYQSAIARVQERTPAFTILQPASVPIKPAGPKRMLFVLIITLITFIGLTIYSVIKDQSTSN